MRVEQTFLGHYLDPEQSQRLTLLTLREFKKPKHLRTTPYLLLKKVL